MVDMKGEGSLGSHEFHMSPYDIDTADVLKHVAPMPNDRDPFESLLPSALSNSTASNGSLSSNVQPITNLLWLRALSSIFVLGVVYLSAKVYLWLRSPLYEVPNAHWSSPFSRCWILYAIYKDRRRYAHYDAHMRDYAKHGTIRPLIRVGPNEVSVMSIEGLQAAYEAGWEKSENYLNFTNFNGTWNMFSSQSRAAHDKRKRILSPAYSRHSIFSDRIQGLINVRVNKVLGFLEDVTSETRLAGQKIEKRSTFTSGHLVGRNIFRALGVDIFTAFAFSEKVSTNFSDELGRGCNSMKDLGMEAMELWYEDTRENFFMFEREPEFRCVAWIWTWLGKGVHERFERFLLNTINAYERIDPIALPQKTVYGRMMEWRDPSSGKGFDRLERASEIMDHMGAGLDPIPCTLEALLQNLSANPTHQQRLQSELRSRLVSNLDESSYAVIDSLPFLNACIVETLRMVTTIETYQPRVVPRGGRTISGYYLPEGTIISTQPHLMNNHPEIFPHPFTFDPDRWITTPEHYRFLLGKMFTFSKGPYACLGRELAMSVMKFTAAKMLLRFEVDAVPTEKKIWTCKEESLKPEIIFRRIPEGGQN